MSLLPIFGSLKIMIRYRVRELKASMRSVLSNWLIFFSFFNRNKGIIIKKYTKKKNLLSALNSLLYFLWKKGTVNNISLTVIGSIIGVPLLVSVSVSIVGLFYFI